MKKVVKFGGSSLANAKQFKKVADIIKADKSRRYVVPSAPGKRNDKDEKVTDMLYACYDAVTEGRSYKKILDKIKERYNEIIDGLDLNLNLDHEFDKIEENFLAQAGRDYAASRGSIQNDLSGRSRVRKFYRKLIVVQILIDRVCIDHIFSKDHIDLTFFQCQNTSLIIRDNLNCNRLDIWLFTPVSRVRLENCILIRYKLV